MELRNLKTFQLAAEYLNFTKVAAELNFSQPTITAQIKSLEQELGHTLFSHIGKKTYLTPAGELLKTHADTILNDILELEKSFYEFSQPSGHLYVAGYETFCTDTFPIVLSKYLAFHNNVDIKLCSSSRERVIKGIQENKYDLGIISGSVNHPSIECHYLSEEKLKFVVSRDLYEQYTFEQLLERYPLIEYRVDEHYSAMTDMFLEKSNVSSNRVIEFGSVPAIKKAIQNSLGIGIVDELSVRNEITSGNFVSLDRSADNIFVRSSLILLKSKCEWATAIEFISILKDVWEECCLP